MSSQTNISILVWMEMLGFPWCKYEGVDLARPVEVFLNKTFLLVTIGWHQC